MKLLSAEFFYRVQNDKTSPQQYILPVWPTNRYEVQMTFRLFVLRRQVTFSVSCYHRFHDEQTHKPDTKLIRKIYLYNFDPLKPHFYIVKLGVTGVYVILLISALKHRLLVLVRTILTSTHNLCLEQKYEKCQNLYLKTFSFFLWWNFQYIWIGVFS